MRCPSPLQTKFYRLSLNATNHIQNADQDLLKIFDAVLCSEISCAQHAFSFATTSACKPFCGHWMLRRLLGVGWDVCARTTASLDASAVYSPHRRILVGLQTGSDQAIQENRSTAVMAFNSILREQSFTKVIDQEEAFFPIQP